jgi:hypothetical protein
LRKREFLAHRNPDKAEAASTELPLSKRSRRFSVLPLFGLSFK